MGMTAAQIGAALKAQVELQAKALVLDLVKALMRATPVDTGHARRNWFASIGQPVTEPSDSGAGAANAAVSGYKLEAGPLYVSNPVDYVFYLNYGSSEEGGGGLDRDDGHGGPVGREAEVRLAERWRDRVSVRRRDRRAGRRGPRERVQPVRRGQEIAATNERDGSVLRRTISRWRMRCTARSSGPSAASVRGY
jgi:hypothetical protein